MTPDTQEFVVAIDTGGTFTDCVAVGTNGTLIQAKVSSTPPDFSVGILAGFGALAEAAGQPLEPFLANTKLFLHGLTVVTNLLVTGRGIADRRPHHPRASRRAPHHGGSVGQVEGVSDAEIRHIGQIDKPEPILPKDRIVEITERIDQAGDVVELNEAEVRDGVRKLAPTTASRRSPCACCGRSRTMPTSGGFGRSSRRWRRTST